MSRSFNILKILYPRKTRLDMNISQISNLQCCNLVSDLSWLLLQISPHVNIQNENMILWGHDQKNILYVHPWPTLLKQSDHLEIELLWHFLLEQDCTWELAKLMLFSTFHCLDPELRFFDKISCLSGHSFIWLLPPFIANRGTRKRVLLDHRADFKFEILSIPDSHSKSLNHNFMQKCLFNFDKRADTWLQIGICLVSFPKLCKNQQILFLRKHLVSR